MGSYRYEDVVERLQSAGCVQPFLHDFITQFIDGGYTILSSREYARSASHFGRWMDLHGISASRVTESSVFLSRCSSSTRKLIRRASTSAIRGRSCGRRATKRRTLRSMSGFNEKASELKAGNSTSLKLNYFWPQNYITSGPAGNVTYDDVVIARVRVGCLT